MTNATNMANLLRRKASLIRKIEHQQQVLETATHEYLDRIAGLQADLDETLQQIARQQQP